MKKSEIHIEVTLDEQNIPEKIHWQATDAPSDAKSEIKAMNIALWDESEQGTLKIDLWNKEMQIHEMKRFIIENISGMAATIRNATADEVMATEIENLCKSLSDRLETEIIMQEKQQG